MIKINIIFKYNFNHDKEFEMLQVSLKHSKIKF